MFIAALEALYPSNLTGANSQFGSAFQVSD
jgi:hypothetical protein